MYKSIVETRSIHNNASSNNCCAQGFDHVSFPHIVVHTFKHLATGRHTNDQNWEVGSLEISLATRRLSHQRGSAQFDQTTTKFQTSLTCIEFQGQKNKHHEYLPDTLLALLVGVNNEPVQPLNTRTQTSFSLGCCSVAPLGLHPLQPIEAQWVHQIAQHPNRSKGKWNGQSPVQSEQRQSGCGTKG